MEKPALLAELAEHGVTSNDYGPAEKQPKGVLVGMVSKVRADAAARARGAGPCPLHPDQVEGVCPYCRGIWGPLEDTQDLAMEGFT